MFKSLLMLGIAMEPVLRNGPWAEVMGGTYEKQLVPAFFSTHRLQMDGLP